MKIIPAIDIKDSKVVRLTKGDFKKSKIYSDYPEEVALRWQEKGARYLHVIDLDGAEKGKLSNQESIKKIIKLCDLKLQAGGGIRDKETILNLLDMGIHKVILGTMVKEKFSFFRQLFKRFQDNIIVALDVRKSQVVIRGWKRNTGVKYIEFAKKLQDTGVREIIFTDVLRDGTLGGPNFEAIEKLLDSVNIPIIASGGISSLKQVKRLYNLSFKGISGVILGKSLYEEKISLQECIKKFQK